LAWKHGGQGCDEMATPPSSEGIEAPALHTTCGHSRANRQKHIRKPPHYPQP